MNVYPKIKSVLLSPWMIALFLLCIFLLTTNYKYGWDDQHVEIPLLKSLIDHTLYAGDYYVESLKKNFPSYLYHILAKLITVDQIPDTYFFLYLISRYFLFFWIYKLWLLISKKRLTALSCMLSFLLISRVYEFLYRTFSHQEFALAIIFAGIYFFFKERFILSALLLGLATNIHALYSAFPFMFLSFYLLWQFKKHGMKTLLKVIFVYLIASTPFILWIIKTHLTAENLNAGTKTDWKSLYLMACPQNFMLPPVPFSILMSKWENFFNIISPYLVLISLFFLNIVWNHDFRKNKKALAYCICAFGLLIICLIFTYIHPIRIVLDLNLTRNAQYLSFLLMGFTTLLLIKNIHEKHITFGFYFGLLLTFFKYDNLIKLYTISLIFLLLLFDLITQKNKNIWRRCGLIGIFLIIVFIIRLIAINFYNTSYRPAVYLSFIAIFLLLAINFFVGIFIKNERERRAIKIFFYLIPLLISFIQFRNYNLERQKKEQYSFGYWNIRRSWVDMQKYVKEYTPEDAILLVPYDLLMGGFRIHSERQIVASERDHGIVGFDYQSALEWQKRIDDIQPFKIQVQSNYIVAIKNAIEKYNITHIVFMRYATPPDFYPFFRKIYVNMNFALYEVIR